MITLRTRPIDELTVMIVDDEPTQRLAVTVLCRSIGTERVIAHETAIQALNDLGAGADNIDLVICDLDLPEMDGIELIRRIAALPGRIPPLLILSGHDTAVLASVEAMGRSYGLTMLASERKPLTRLVLEPALRTLLIPVEIVDGTTPSDGARIDRLIDAERFEPFFQPQISLADGRVRGAEVLARLRDEDGSILPPSAFLPRLEERGLMGAFTLTLFRMALTHARRWRDSGAEVTLSFNLSPLLLDDLDLIPILADMVTEAGVRRDSILFEIVETAVAKDALHQLESAARLRMRGFGLSIDDYGTGHSTLEQLRRLPFTELKIDQAFVHGLHDNPASRAIVANTISMARDLSLRVVAEGVETHEQAHELRVLGCEIGQGFFWSPPVSAEGFGQHIINGRI